MKTDYQLKLRGDWMREGKCPSCGRKELYTRADSPWLLKCGRENRCGWDGHVKQLYPDIFDDWSKRYRVTEASPAAAADAYLHHARGFNLAALRSSYTQEYYHDQGLSIGSATVRFPLPGGGWWERLIDQPSRFGKMKARFAPGGGYRGRWWQAPGTTMQDLARADQIWICEGIFDAIALAQAGRSAVSVMSCNNFPELALADLRRACADHDLAGPKLIWAFDVGRAGVEYTRRFVKRGRDAGWQCGAAQVREDGEGEKLDWNDLAQRDKLTAEDLETYLWNGEVTIARVASEKAVLLYQRYKIASFPLVFQNRQMWARFDLARINEIIEEWGDMPAMKGLSYAQKFDLAAKEAAEVSEIANCAFRALYFQRDEAADDSAYYFAIDFPSDRPRIKGTFSGSSLAASAEFKKRLISLAPGGIWTGSTQQLDRLMQRQLVKIKSVEAIQFTGYSADHQAWILGDIAVHKGRVFEPNDEDYFDFGKQQVKLRSSERTLTINYDSQKLDLFWVPLISRAFGAKGLAMLAFWFGSLFAEQIREEQKSLAFLEATGEPGTGKTTLIEFLWRLCGREDYEGFDPVKSTPAARARNLGKVANLPVVLLEGDRSADTPHSRKFEWDELKTAYNGRSVRSRGVANGGMETFEPPFRGAIVIAQNAPVEASPAIIERIMALIFDKTGWSVDTKEAAEAIERIKTEQVSSFIIHAIRREEEIMATYRAAFAKHEKAMLADPEIRNGRLAKNHAQLAAMFDAMRIIVPNIAERDALAVHELIRAMVRERQLAVNSDHPHVQLFWERYDWLASLITPGAINPINHSVRADTIAINLVQFEQLCGEHRLSLPCTMNELKRLLKSSKERKFLCSKVTRSYEKTLFCWHFSAPKSN
ncbi:toprim domain-containing protein [Govanella unica]|uniref:Toprim domain-containing protein n=1 Tax=Govanella unica TaxID=2975056 RepID=A0A9X3Z654_9PROT|nr:toprim domain-containing protein [Govania unica]MDA5192781.1 toprim domain-containing protein [Govania unica]